jgi:hypothetical protein
MSALRLHASLTAVSERHTTDGPEAPVWAIGLREGARLGLLLAPAVVVLAVLGLTPSLAWIPEVPLLGAGGLVPLLAIAIAGFRAGSRSGRAVGGLEAGALVGAIGGLVGGLCYVAFGKPALNVPVGLLAGATAGAVVGLLAGLLGRR